MKKNKHNQGFTLIELLVVISIIGLLSTVIVASLMTARMKARNTYTSSAIKQYLNAIELAKTPDGRLPFTPTAGTYCLGQPVAGDCGNGVFDSGFNTFISQYLSGSPSPVPNKTNAAALSPGAYVFAADTNGDGTTDYLDMMWTMQTANDPCVIPGSTKTVNSSTDYFCSLKIALWKANY